MHDTRDKSTQSLTRKLTGYACRIAGEPVTYISIRDRAAWKSASQRDVCPAKRARGGEGSGTLSRLSHDGVEVGMYDAAAARIRNADAVLED